MQERLAQVFARIVRVRTDDQSTLEINLFDDVAAAKFERAGLAAGRQKLEQVRDTHRVQSSVNSHRMILFCSSCEIRGGVEPRQPELRPTIQTLPRLHFWLGKFQVFCRNLVPEDRLWFCQLPDTLSVQVGWFTGLYADLVLSSVELRPLAARACQST